VSANLRQGVVLLWEAFKTYFTISTILFTAFSFLQSGSSSGRKAVSSLSVPARHNLSLGIALIGVVISVFGWFAIARFVAYQQAFLDRGRALEPKCALMHSSLSVWNRRAIGMPMLTLAVVLVVGVLLRGAMFALCSPSW